MTMVSRPIIRRDAPGEQQAGVDIATEEIGTAASVPAPGGWLTPRASVASSLHGDQTGRSTHHTAITASRSRQNMASRLRRSCRHPWRQGEGVMCASARIAACRWRRREAKNRIDDHLTRIRGSAQAYSTSARIFRRSSAPPEQGKPHQYRIVAGGQRVDMNVAPGQSNTFSVMIAPEEQPRQLEAQQGDNRQQGVAQGMFEDHRALLQPLGAGGRIKSIFTTSSILART